MSDALLKRFDLDRLDTVRVEGHVPVAGLARLREMHQIDGGQLFARLEFDANGEGRILITGQIQGSLNLTCQRCLESFAFDLDRGLALAVVDEETPSVELPAGFEPYLPEKNSVTGLEVVEEELMLNLPMSPSHKDESDCGELLKIIKTSSLDDAGDVAEGFVRPFEVLKELKK